MPAFQTVGQFSSRSTNSTIKQPAINGLEALGQLGEPPAELSLILARRLAPRIDQRVLEHLLAVLDEVFVVFQ
jgi:hypothetical protein